jgi:hypothetical protein
LEPWLPQDNEGVAHPQRVWGQGEYLEPWLPQINEGQG